MRFDRPLILTINHATQYSSNTENNSISSFRIFQGLMKREKVLTGEWYMHLPEVHNNQF